jgi:uncharacterized protein (DUF302 family)
MVTQCAELGLHARMEVPYEAAIERVTAALKEQGFGVLTTIDVKNTLKQKIGADFRKYAILGACNPTLANRALNTDVEIGLLLPCNVIVYEEVDQADGVERSVVSILNPFDMMSMVQNPALAPIAEEANERLSRVVAALEATTAASVA